MKICLITTWPLIKSHGGAEKIFCDLSNYLSMKGHDVLSICHENKEGFPAFQLNRNIRFQNIYSLPIPIRYSWLVRKIRELSFTKQRVKRNHFILKAEVLSYKFKSLFREYFPDIIVSFQIETTYALKLAIGDKIPIITMLHNSPLSLFPEHVPTMVRRVVETSTLIQVLRPEFKDELTSILPNAKIVVIPNPVPQFSEHSDLSAKTIINVARISSEKRLDLLIEAFNLIKNDFPDWNVQIWGEDTDSKLKHRLDKLIFHLKLDEQIKFCGTSNDIPSKLKQASIFAFPSETEGFPLALTEAQSMGLPCVGCESCPAVNSLIRHKENGLLAKDNAESFALALKCLMTDQNLREKYGSEAKKDMKQFSPQNIWSTWEHLLETIVNQKHSC